jgi:hypothetical protein
MGESYASIATRHLIGLFSGRVEPERAPVERERLPVERERLPVEPERARGFLERGL